ncbi:MAG: sulfatase [bacterium]|nr:sulfatase [bacterium]
MRCRSPLRRSLTLLAALFSLACQPPAPASEIPKRLRALGQPDVVLILIDTLRADWTTPYGFEKDTTPELARWASRGIVFERTLAQSSWTKMSVASLMTSLWPRSHNIRDARDGLGEGAITLAETLQAAGYATYGVQTNGWLHQSFGFHQGFDRYMFPTGAKGQAHEKPSLWAHADRVVEEAERLIEAREPDRPMFLYLHFMDVHEYAAPPEFQIFGTNEASMYQASTLWVDDALRRVREALEASGRMDQTILVLGSDHGETFGEHGIHGHARNVLTPVNHVPLVVRLPFAIEPVRVASQVRNVDLAPTLLELSGVPIPESFEGASLLPLATGAEAGVDRPSHAALGVPLFPNASVQSSLSTGTWMYARNAPRNEEDPKAYESQAVAPGAELLFDRRVDPGENVNLISLEPGEVERMRMEFDAHWQRKPADAVLERGVRIDPGIADRLRAMGYLR